MRNFIKASKQFPRDQELMITHWYRVRHSNYRNEQWKQMKLMLGHVRAMFRYLLETAARSSTGIVIHEKFYTHKTIYAGISDKCARWWTRINLKLAYLIFQWAKSFLLTVIIFIFLVNVYAVSEKQMLILTHFYAIWSFIFFPSYRTQTVNDKKFIARTGGVPEPANVF